MDTITIREALEFNRQDALTAAGSGYREEKIEYFPVCSYQSAMVIFSPSTSDVRMAQITSVASGFIYCLARKA